MIDRFILKGSSSVATDISTYMKELVYEYFVELTQPMLKLLELEEKLPHTDPVFIDFFNQLTEKHHITEYYLLDKQGSMLCIDQDNNKHYLKVHTKRSLEQWVAMYQDSGKLNQQELESVKAGEKIPFFGPGTEAWQVDSESWSKNLVPATRLEGRVEYYWSLI